MPILFATSPLAAIRSAPPPRGPPARGQSATRRCVGDHPVGDAGASSSQAVRRAPWSSGRVSSTHTSREPPLLPGREQHAARRAVARRGERARVAVGERAVALPEALGARAARRRSPRSCSGWSRRAVASGSAAQPALDRPGQVHGRRPGVDGARPPPRDRQRARARRPRPRRSPVRRVRRACGCSRPPARALAGDQRPRPAAPAGRARAVRRARSAAGCRRRCSRAGRYYTHAAETLRARPPGPSLARPARRPSLDQRGLSRVAMTVMNNRDRSAIREEQQSPGARPAASAAGR